MAEDWTDEELEAAIGAYIEMRDKLWLGEQIVKRDYFKDLAAKHKRRTEKSFEYRMQNISHVYELIGRQWIAGFRPARNVGRRTAERIQHIIESIEDQATIDDAGFVEQVNRSRGDRNRPAPMGDRLPARQRSTVTVYARSPNIVAWVLDRADGYCESCETAAPFVTGAGRPYLEVHHLRRLADGGPDTVDNAVALCPNCHRALHYSNDAKVMKSELIERIERLVAY